MSRNKTSEFFDAYAHDFDAIYGSDRGLKTKLLNRLFRASMRLRYRKTIEGCRPYQGRSVLDIGCGPGHYGVALARAGIAEVWGIDFAPAMIDLARRKAAAAGVNDRCRFIQGDFLDHTFDLCIRDAGE